MAFRDLGLAIIDEEQRFGVRQKERLKEWRRTVDVLTLTATPIPRTLQLSLTGLRELSLINTPPENRRAIRTYVCRPEPEVIQAAIRRELARSGQVFFVHNRVRSLGVWARHVQEMVPEARVAMAHGQMPEKELEQVMVRFWHREVDVLVCTAIIEAGLDIPAANTIIINRAHTMGLAQLYQLRGRVGRSQAQAYAYLLVPDEAALTSEAQKRLKALMEFTELGSGFKIAMHDLQIRGAGNLLGQAQSGQVAEVGYELYLQLLEGAIREYKGEAPVDETPDPEIHLPLAAYLPEDYVPDVQQRLALYRRLSGPPDPGDGERTGGGISGSLRTAAAGGAQSPGGGPGQTPLAAVGGQAPGYARQCGGVAVCPSGASGCAAFAGYAQKKAAHLSPFTGANLAGSSSGKRLTY